jgi:hypothetical protein
MPGSNPVESSRRSTRSLSVLRSGLPIAKGPRGCPSVTIAGIISDAPARAGACRSDYDASQEIFSQVDR